MIVSFGSPHFGTMVAMLSSYSHLITLYDIGLWETFKFGKRSHCIYDMDLLKLLQWKEKSL